MAHASVSKGILESSYEFINGVGGKRIELALLASFSMPGWSRYLDPEIAKNSYFAIKPFFILFNGVKTAVFFLHAAQSSDSKTRIGDIKKGVASLFLVGIGSTIVATVSGVLTPEIANSVLIGLGLPPTLLAVDVVLNKDLPAALRSKMSAMLFGVGGYMALPSPVGMNFILGSAIGILPFQLNMAKLLPECVETSLKRVEEALCEKALNPVAHAVGYVLGGLKSCAVWVGNAAAAGFHKVQAKVGEKRRERGSCCPCLGGSMAFWSFKDEVVPDPVSAPAAV